MNILRTEHNKKTIKKFLTCALDDTFWEDIVSEVTFTIFTSFQWLLDVTVKDVLDFFCMFLTFYAIELVIVVKCFFYFWASKNFTCYYMLVVEYSNWLVYHGLYFSDVVWDWGKVLFVMIFVSVVCFREVVLLKAAIACILLSLSLMILLVFVMRQYLFVVFF